MPPMKEESSSSATSCCARNRSRKRRWTESAIRTGTTTTTAVAASMMLLLLLTVAWSSSSLENAAAPIFLVAAFQSKYKYRGGQRQLQFQRQFHHRFEDATAKPSSLLLRDASRGHPTSSFAEPRRARTILAAAAASNSNDSDNTDRGTTVATVVRPTGTQRSVVADELTTRTPSSIDGRSDNDDKASWSFPRPRAMLMNPMESFDLGEEEHENETAPSDALSTSTTMTTTTNTGDNTDDYDYKKGLATVGFITFLFSTNSPVLHGAFSGDHPPPVLLVNASVSLVALVGLLLSGDQHERKPTAGLPRDEHHHNDTNADANTNANAAKKWIGGIELGTWKFLGTTLNVYGLALTTACHGALLIQLTTLIVPTFRGIVYKEAVPDRVKLSIGLALAGVLCFSQDIPSAATELVSGESASTRLLGDGLCVGAAVCYSAYDLRLYEYGKDLVDDAKDLITRKIAVQAVLSVALLCLAPCSLRESLDYGGSLLFGFFGSTTSGSSGATTQLQSSLSSSSSWIPLVAAVVWSGVAVNAVAPFLQVRGQQIVGPTKCQTIYASQPLWAAGLSYVFLGETLGVYGMVGGGAFLVALGLAATAANTNTTTPEASASEARDAPATSTTTNANTVEDNAMVSKP